MLHVFVQKKAESSVIPSEVEGSSHFRYVGMKIVGTTCD